MCGLVSLSELTINKPQVPSSQDLANRPPWIAKADDVVVVYNRVPKTGSTSFIGVAYELCKKNKFRVLHVNITANNHVLSLNNQYNFVHNITDWNVMKPAVYHGHFAFVDFSKYFYTILRFLLNNIQQNCCRFGVPKPLFINIIRKPLDRFISYYYFVRYGDNYRPYLIRKKHGNTMVSHLQEELNVQY